MALAVVSVAVLTLFLVALNLREDVSHGHEVSGHGAGQVISADGAAECDPSESASTDAVTNDTSGDTSYLSDEVVADEAASVLRGYESGGSSILAFSGYVDLFGDAWACVVRGPGWVDICLVTSREGGGCGVSVTRLSVDEWRESYEAK